MNPTRELNFAYKVRHALNENLDTLPPATLDRLAAARQLALSRKKQSSPLQALFSKPALATQGGTFSFADAPSWLARMGLAIPLIVLVVGLMGIYQSEQERYIQDTAEIDAGVLSDDLPLSAYLDHGFNAYLAARGE